MAVHVARGASYVIVKNSVTTAILALSFAVLARLITPSEMGILAVLVLVNGLSQSLASLGLPMAATKFIAEHMQASRNVAASAFYQSVRTTLFLSAIIGFAVFLAAPTLAVGLLGSAAYSALFQLLGVDIVVSAGALPVLMGAMVGLRKFREASVLGIVNISLRQSLILILIFLMQDLQGLVLAWLLTDIAATVMYGSYVVKTLGRPTFGFPLAELLRFSWPVSLNNLVKFAYTSYDRALLLAFVPLSVLGVYNVALTAFNALLSIPDAIAIALLPSYSAIEGGNRREVLCSAVRNATRYVALIGVPVALGLFATAKPTLELFVGRTYEEASLPLMILSGALAFTVFEVALAPALLAIAETRVTLMIRTVSMLSSLAAASLLILPLGMIGASISRAVAMLVTMAITTTYLGRRLQLRIDFNSISKVLGGGVAMVLFLLLLQSVIYDKILVPLYAVLGTIVYLSILRFFNAVQREDIQLVRRYLGGRLFFFANLFAKLTLKEREKSD